METKRKLQKSAVATIESVEEATNSVSNERSDANLKILFVTLKLLLFGICTVGFVYQVADYFSYYRTYPTVIEIKRERRDDIIFPAITFCHIRR